MYGDLKTVLDKDYANTEDFDDYLVEADVFSTEGKGLIKLKGI